MVFTSSHLIVVPTAFSFLPATKKEVERKKFHHISRIPEAKKEGMPSRSFSFVWWYCHQVIVD
jgi:hypothetical protein